MQTDNATGVLHRYGSDVAACIFYNTTVHSGDCASLLTSQSLECAPDFPFSGNNLFVAMSGRPN